MTPTRILCAAVAMLVGSMALAAPANARGHHRHGVHHKVSGDPRPGRWCGWYMRHYFHVADRSYNLARKWAGYGSPAPNNCVRCVAVWRHHVGYVQDRNGGSILLHSGNDGHAVRTRWRPTRSIIAYRWA